MFLLRQKCSMRKDFSNFSLPLVDLSFCNEFLFLFCLKHYKFPLYKSLRTGLGLRSKTGLKERKLVTGFVFWCLVDLFTLVCCSPLHFWSWTSNSCCHLLTFLGFDLWTLLFQEENPSHTQTFVRNGFGLSNKCRLITGRKDFYCGPI